MTLGRAWVDAVIVHLQPVFDAADVGFECNQVNESAMLWEADPRQFAERYPDSDIIATYGVDQWPSVHCIDFWFYLDRGAEGEVLVSFEGWHSAHGPVAVTGDPDIDGSALAQMLSTHLRLDRPGSDAAEPGAGLRLDTESPESPGPADR